VTYVIGLSDQAAQRPTYVSMYQLFFGNMQNVLRMYEQESETKFLRYVLTRIAESAPNVRIDDASDSNRR
jgi:hypothetical protein